MRFPHDHIDWPRYLFAPDVEPPLDRGFLAEGMGDEGRPAKSLPFTHVREWTPHLLLIGELGLGKSHELYRAYEHARNDGQAALFLNAPLEADLTRAILDAEEVSEWLHRGDDSRLHVFVDGLDDVFRRGMEDAAAQAAAEVGNALKHLPVERVKLGLAGRAAMHERSQALATLEQHLGVKLAVSRLAPLRHRDMAAAARAVLGERAPGFIHAVDSLDLGLLASRPRTLLLFLRLAQEQRLPGRRGDVFAHVCLSLCGREDDAWIPFSASGRTRRALLGEAPALDAHERLAVAMRIAAVSVLAQRPYVSLDPAGTPDAVRPGDIAGDAPVEPVDRPDARVELVVTPRMVTETVADTGLFDGDGRRFTWVHQEFAHFLASRWLARHGLSEPQMRSLLGYGAEREGLRLVPQLEELAAWIDDDFAEPVRHLVIDLAPMAQVHGNVAGRSDADKQRIVAALLDAYERELIVERLPLSFEGGLTELKHPELAAQLRTVLMRHQARILTRATAASLAGTCGVRELAMDLAAVAIDLSEPYGLRSDVAFALLRLDDKAASQRLARLFDAPPETDPDDKLKGIALRLAWKDQPLSAQDFFSILTPPQNPNLVNFYSSFLGEETLVPEIEQRFGIEGLRAGLRWVARHRDDRLGRGRLARAICTRALDRLDDGVIRDLLAEIVHNAFDRHRSPTWLREFAGDRSVLRALFQSVRTRLRAEHGRPALPEHALLKILTREDAPWLLAWWDDEPAADVRESLAVLVRSLLHGQAPSAAYDLLLARYAPDPERHRAFRDLVVWDLEDDRTRVLRDPQPAESLWTDADVARILAELEQGGQPDSWPTLVHALTLAAHRQSEHDFTDKPIVTYPGWEQADGAQRQRLTTAAERFLRAHDDWNADWLQSHRWHTGAAAGLHAWIALAAEAPERLLEIPAEVWQAWTPAIAVHAFPPLDESVLERLAPLVVAHAAAAMIDTFEALSPAELRTSRMGRWNLLWVPGLSDVVAWRLGDPTLPSEILSTWVPELFRHDPALAWEIVEPILDGLAPDQERDEDDVWTHEHWIAAAAAALDHDASAVWPRIWRCIREDRVLGERLMAIALRFDPGAAAWLDRLAPAQWAELYRWIDARYHERTAAHAGFMMPRLALVWRAAEILDRLATHGSWEALDELEALDEMYPEDPGIRWALVEAGHGVRRNDWQPPATQHILALAAESKRRLLYHASHVQEAIPEIVAGLGRDWGIDVQRFWQRVPDDAFEPVPLNALCSLLGDALERVFAQVAVHAPVRVSAGERNTLHLDAGVSPGVHGIPITVDVAVLPSWEPDPVASLETLLREPGAGTRHWVVLLAWFGGPAWTRRHDHERRSVAMRRSRGDTERLLVAAAQAIARANDLSVAVSTLDLELAETAADLQSGLAWGHALLDRLRAEGMRVARFASVGGGDRWHLSVELPADVSERLGLAPRVMMLAGSGALSWQHVRRAQDDLQVAHVAVDSELDPDVLVIVDDSPDLAARVNRMPGRAGQCVAWTLADPRPLATHMAQSLAGVDFFEMRNPVRGRQFTGREASMRELERRILGSEGCGVFGLRKSGKTSLVRAVIDRLDPVSAAPPGSALAVDADPAVLAVWLDVQGLVERSEEALWRVLLRRAGERLHAAGIEVPAPEGDVFRDLDQLLRTSLDSAALPGPWCFVFDEADLLFENLSGGPGIPCLRLLRFLRALAQETERVATVFIGRDSTFLDAPMLEGGQNPMLGWVVPFWMDRFARDDADMLLTRLARRAGLYIDQDNLARAHAWSGGHVILLRQLGAALWALARERGVDTTAGIDEDAMRQAFLDRPAVRTVCEETVGLLERRYPEAHALLIELLTGEDPGAVLARHLGWNSKAAKALRNFTLMSGTAAWPSIPPWLRWYAAWIGLVSTQARTESAPVPAADSDRMRV
jgi:hypothetical protein